MEEVNKTAPEMLANYLLDKWKNRDVVVVVAVENNLASICYATKEASFIYFL